MLINDGLPFRSGDALNHFPSTRAFHEAHRVGRLRWVAYALSIDARIPDSSKVRAQAARLVVPEHAVASDDYAAFVHGVDTRSPANRFEQRPMFVVQHTRYRSTHSYALVRQSKHIPNDDVVEIEGLRVTNPLRTAADLLRLKRRPYALAAADAMAFAGVIDPETLRAYIGTLQRLPGLPQAQELAGRVTHLAESHGESWQRCRILDAGFPTPILQHRVIDSYGVERRLDMAYEEVLTASEYDGREFHTAAADTQADEVRRSDLSERLGWRFNLGTYERIFGTSTAFEDELGDFLGQAPGPRTWH
ncbi:MAG TPA: hypothetical protein VLS51_02600 [Propionibacteriaceae bacterium]|nr:hypothetical protein [Propionibacteriaceae bacterium]